MNKYTSGATCGAGVALASHNDVLWVAFPGGGGLGGASPNYKLNIMPVQQYTPSDAWSFARLLVLEQETSMEQPALTSFGGKLWLAWTGTDPAHRVNLLRLAVDAESHVTAETGSKITFNWTATGGPSLCVHAARLYLAFSGGGGSGGAQPNGALNLAWSSDGANWPQSQLTVFNQYHSLLSPALAELPNAIGAPTEPYRLFVSFTGTNHLLYVNETGSQIPPLKNAGDNDFETSDFAPALTALLGPEGWGLACVWTGSGNNRHIYMTVEGLGYSDNVSHHEAFSETSAFAPAAITLDSKLYLAWAGTDGVHRLNVADFAQLQKIPS